MDLLPISPASGLQTKIRPSPLFSDRDQLVSYFRENILEPPENPAHNIIAIWGQDGLGKSTLLSRFVYEARTLPAREYCFSALVNYRHTSPLIIMGEFAEQLRRQGHPLPLFERELLVSTNQEHTHPTKKSQEARTIGWFQRMLKSSRAFLGQISPLGRRLANLRIGAALALPEESLYRDIQGSGPPLQETLLTQTFVKDLNQLTRTLVRVRHDGSKRERRIILFFDAFEHMPPSTVSWFLNRLLAQMISDQVVLVLAGTNPIDHTIADDPRHWSNYIEALYPISLQPLTAEQTRDYLAEKGITEPEWVDWVWKDSQGIPIKVDILATQLNLIGEALTTTEQKLVLHAALFSRPFTQDDLAAFSFISPSVRAAHFQWLTSLPFAHKTLSGRYNYHKLARRQFGTYFHKNFREDYKQARQELASYYRGLLGKLFPEPASQELHTSPGWLELKLALAYQWFLVPERDDHVRALLQVLHAYESTHRREEIRQMLDEMLEDTDTMGLSEESLQFINQLQRYILADEPGKEKELLEATNDLLSTSIPFRSSPPSSQLLPGIIAGVYQKRGDAALLLQQYEQALADFERALRMNSKPNNQGYYLKSVAFQTFFSLGLYHKERQGYLQAIKNFTSALDLKEEAAEIYAHRGAVHCLIQHYEQAIKDLTRAFEGGIQQAWAYMSRGIAYNALKDYQHAIKDFTHILDSNPLHAEAYVHRGEAYRLCKDYGQALLDLERALELNPQFAAAYFQRGLIYRELNENDHAIEDLTQALTLDPQNGKAYTSRGRIYRLQAKYKQAIQDFTNALRLSRYSAEIYTSRGEAYRQNGSYKQAIKDFDRAIKIDLYYARAYASRADAYRLSGSYDEALEDFNQALALDATSAWAFAQRGETYTSLKNYTHALEDFNSALSLDPTSASIYASRGGVFCLLGSYKQGIDNLDRAINLDPKLASAYCARGAAYIHLKEYERAHEDLQRAIKEDPRLALAYLQHGRLHLTRHEYQPALEHLDFTINLDPGNAWAYYQRGLARLGLRELSRARTDFEHCRKLDESIVNAACMAEWTRICEEGIDRGMAKRLDEIAHIDADRYESQICQGVALWLHEDFAAAIERLEQACRLRPERWDALFWRGVVCASLGKAEEAITIITSALELGMPPVLLAALYVLKTRKPAFYQDYASPLLSRYSGQVPDQREFEG